MYGPWKGQPTAPPKKLSTRVAILLLVEKRPGILRKVAVLIVARTLDISFTRVRQGIANLKKADELSLRGQGQNTCLWLPTRWHS